MGFTEEELEAGDYRYHLLKDEGRLDEMLNYNGLYSSRVPRCRQCNGEMKLKKVKNEKLDNGDPNYIGVMTCASCGHSRRQTKMEYGLTWG